MRFPSLVPGALAVFPFSSVWFWVFSKNTSGSSDLPSNSGFRFLPILFGSSASTVVLKASGFRFSSKFTCGFSVLDDFSSGLTMSNNAPSLLGQLRRTVGYENIVKHKHITQVTELWNRIKNSYIGHTHKHLQPHLYTYFCMFTILIFNS